MNRLHLGFHGGALCGEGPSLDRHDQSQLFPAEVEDKCTAFPKAPRLECDPCGVVGAEQLCGADEQDRQPDSLQA